MPGKTAAPTSRPERRWKGIRPAGHDPPAAGELHAIRRINPPPSALHISSGGTMTHIQIDPQAVRDTGNKIKTKKDELQGIIEEAKRVMDALRDGFKGKRSQNIFTEWDQIHPALGKSFENLQRAGQLLETAANQFEEVDNAA